MKKIAFFKIGALGDVLMTTPLVREIRRLNPHAQIDYLVGEGSKGVLDGNPNIDLVIGFDEKILHNKRIWELKKITDIVAGYDIVFVLDKHWIFSLLAFVARVPIRLGFSRDKLCTFFLTEKIAYGQRMHEIICYLKLGQALDPAVDQTDLGLDLPTAKEFPLKRPYVVLINSGGSNGFEDSTVRRLPVDLFAELVQNTVKHTSVVFLGTSSERQAYEPFESDATINLCGKTSLHEVIYVLAAADAVFTTDTGLMHMAGACNANVTAIFGPTHPARKCPPAARAVWSDEAIYDDAYEVFGSKPRKAFFKTLSLCDITGTTATKSALPFQ